MNCPVDGGNGHYYILYSNNRIHYPLHSVTLNWRKTLEEIRKRE